MSNVITTHLHTEPDRSIRWVQTVEGEWEAKMVFLNPDMDYRLYDLDAIDLLQVMATIEQYLAGNLPEVYLEPRDSALRRRLNNA